MATKKIKVGKDYDFSITKKSKDTVYVFKNETVAKNTNINLKYDEEIAYHTCAKSGTDLYIVCEFYDWETQTYKVILNTIKDYFKYNSEKPDLITVNEEIVNTAYAYQFVSGTVKDTIDGADFIGDKKATTYNLNNLAINNEGYFDWIEDLGGKDVYNITVANVGIGSDEYFSRVEIFDYSGNDKYNIHPSSLPNNPAYFVGSRFDIYDMKGDDKYTIENERLSGGTGEIIDLAGDDKYSITTSSGISIEDYKGNDNYVLKTTQDIGLYDGYFKWHEDDTVTVTGGKDKYEITGSNEIYVSDLVGKDKYTIDNSSNIMISDGYNYYEEYLPQGIKGGNDTYVISGSDEIYVDDYVGKDSYTIKNNSEDVEINEFTGNDKYSISEASHIHITDGYFSMTVSGDDKYVVKDSDYVRILDFGGNDKYAIENSDNIAIDDKAGNDIYSFKKVDGDGYFPVQDQDGNDEYTITDSEDIDFVDRKGNDTWKISSSDNISIDEELGDDKYNISSSDLYINDGSGKDSYTISSSKATIYDGYGDDSYSVAKNSVAYINDEDTESNDKYKVDLAGKVKINDFGGDSDKLTLTSKAKNLIFMANFNADESGVADGSLIIFDKSKGGFTLVSDYFNTATEEGITIFDGAGEGCIESVKAGKSSLTAKINAFSETDNISELSELVAGWLSNYASDYSNVYEFLQEGSADQIQAFITYAQNPTPISS